MGSSDNRTRKIQKNPIISKFREENYRIQSFEMWNLTMAEPENSRKIQIFPMSERKIQVSDFLM
jgi:hypothetical protein